MTTVFRDALLEAGFSGGLLAPPRGSRRLTYTRESFEVFAQLRVAPEVLSIIALFADQSGLRSHEDFSVSCLPSSSVKPPRLRMTAVKLAWTEVLVVEANKSTGAVSTVTIWAEPDDELEWLSSYPEIEASHSDLDGGGTALVLPGGTALTLLSQPPVARAAATRVAAMRARKQRFRREGWHNRWLWALVDSGVACSPGSVPIADSAWDVSSEDALRVVRRRTSQQAFRQRLLARGPKECAICGIDVEDVLEAAHLVPHSRGGAASSENGRLLCANHHRAYDARLYRWTGERFAWEGPGSEPNLGQK